MRATEWSLDPMRAITRTARPPPESADTRRRVALLERRGGDQVDGPFGLAASRTARRHRRALPRSRAAGRTPSDEPAGAGRRRALRGDDGLVRRRQPVDDGRQRDVPRGRVPPCGAGDGVVVAGERPSRGDLLFMLPMVLGLALCLAPAQAATTTAPNPLLGNVFAVVNLVVWSRSSWRSGRWVMRALGREGAPGVLWMAAEEAVDRPRAVGDHRGQPDGGRGLSADCRSVGNLALRLVAGGLPRNAADRTGVCLADGGQVAAWRRSRARSCFSRSRC